jgi:hypothetical protein
MSYRNSIISRIALFTAVVLLCHTYTLLAQDAVPIEILQRTVFIKVGDVTGTAFAIDYRSRIYLVTARHVVAGVPESNATIQVRRTERWEDLHTVKTLFPPSIEVDIAVFETDEKVLQPFKVTTQGKTGGVTMGQQVWFLGYPFGIGSHVGNDKGTFIPFMKRGTMSAIDSTNPDAVVLYIDGFNNPGFSGGPILFWSFSGQAYEILGVVKGYKEDTAKVLVNGVHVDTQLLVNSGILIGYSIKHALQAIDKGEEKGP